MKFVVVLVAFGFLAYADASCVAARGHVICPDKNQKHDGKLVVIRLVEGKCRSYRPGTVCPQTAFLFRRP